MLDLGLAARRHIHIPEQQMLLRILLGLRLVAVGHGDALVNQSGRLVGLDVTDDGSTSSVADAAAISSALSKAAAGTPVAFAASRILSTTR